MEVKNIQFPKGGDSLNKENTINATSESEVKWNKLSIISIFMLLFFPVFYFISRFIIYPAIYTHIFYSGSNTIIKIFGLIFILYPAMSLLLGFISYSQIKGFITHPKTKKSKEKGAFLSLISIILGIPFTFLWFFFIYIFTNGFKFS